MLHQKFEYKIVNTAEETEAEFTESYLNEMGEKGWEFVTALDEIQMLFKRGYYDD